MRTGPLLSLLVLGAGFSAVAYAKTVTYDRSRIGFVPKDPDAVTVTKDQVSFTVGVIDGTNFRDDPKTFYHAEFTGKNGGKVGFESAACQFPMFRVAVANGSDQTLKLRSSASGSSDEVVVAVDDDLGNTTSARRKAEILANVSIETRKTADYLAADPVAAAAYMAPKEEAMYAALPFLTDDATILPGRKTAFYACFDFAPGARDDQDVNKWFQSRKEITLGFYDVPVQRDAAGVVTKKTSYQVAFDIAEWVDHYEKSGNSPAAVVSSDKLR